MDRTNLDAQEEEALFMRRKDELGVESGWGAFSVGVPGRSGSDVRDAKLSHLVS
jgi:hypothetical protein